MTSQAHRSPAPALEADERAVELLATARMRDAIEVPFNSTYSIIRGLHLRWMALNKPESEISELKTIMSWNETIRDRLLSMADECGKEFAALDENVRDEAEQALGV